MRQLKLWLIHFNDLHCTYNENRNFNSIKRIGKGELPFVFKFQAGVAVYFIWCTVMLWSFPTLYMKTRWILVPYSNIFLFYMS